MEVLIATVKIGMSMAAELTRNDVGLFRGSLARCEEDRSARALLGRI